LLSFHTIEHKAPSCDPTLSKEKSMKRMHGNTAMEKNRKQPVWRARKA